MIQILQEYQKEKDVSYFIITFINILIFVLFKYIAIFSPPSPPKSQQKKSIPTKRRKTDTNERMIKTVPIKDITPCYKLHDMKTSGVIISMKMFRGLYGQLLKCIIADKTGTICILWWNKNADHYQQALKHRHALRIFFSTSDIKYSDPRFTNNTRSPYYIKAPRLLVRRIKSQLQIKFDSLSIKSVINSMNEKMKFDVAGIITKIKPIPAKDNASNIAGYSYDIGDKTACTAYAIWEKINVYEPGDIILIKNAAIRINNTYTSIVNGIDITKLSKYVDDKIITKLQKDHENGNIISMTTFNEEEYLPVTVEKFNDKKEEIKNGIDIKEKYFKTKFNVELVCIDNLSECVYLSRKSDNKNKKLTQEQAFKFEKKQLKMNYHFRIVVSDDDGEHVTKFSIFNKGVIKLLNKFIPPAKFYEYSEKKKTETIDDCVGKKYELFVKSKVVASKGKKILQSHVKKVRYIKSDNEDNKENGYYNDDSGDINADDKENENNDNSDSDDINTDNKENDKQNEYDNDDSDDVNIDNKYSKNENIKNNDNSDNKENENKSANDKNKYENDENINNNKFKNNANDEDEQIEGNINYDNNNIDLIDKEKTDKENDNIENKNK